MSELSELSLEQIINELQQLAKLRPLKGEQQARARELMSELKRRSLTNAEISRLTGWDESTIKQSYTRGVVAVSSADKDRAIDLLGELAARGLALDSVEDFLPLRADLDDRNVKSDEVAALLQEARRANIQTSELVRLPGELKQADLSLVQLKEGLALKVELDKLGFNIETLQVISKATSIYENPTEFLSDLNTFISIDSVKEELEKVSAEKETKQKELEGLATNIGQLSSEKQEIQGSLDLIARLDKDGIDEPILKNLVDLSTKHGGVKGVTEAVKSYATLAAIQFKIMEAKKLYSAADTQLKQVQADLAHLMPVVKMVRTLLYDLKFSVKAVTDLFRVAKEYGTPMEVLEALGKHGAMKELEKQVKVLQATKSELEARVEELGTQLQNLRGVMDEIKRTTTGILGPFAVEVKKAIDSVATTHKELAEKLGGLKADVEALGEPVKLAKVILSADRFPTTAKDLPKDYPLLLATVLKKICIVKGINPKRYPGRIMYEKYSIGRDAEFELLDLLDWVAISLLDELRKT